MTSIDHLAPAEKRKLLAKLLSERRGRGEMSYPLSYGQQGLWFQYKLAPRAYNNPLVLRIRSRFEPKQLVHCLNALVARHDSLRATFAVNDGQLVQRIGPPPSIALPEEDASSWSRSELEERLRSESNVPFDLGTGPLVRARLFFRSATEHLLLIDTPHIISDGVSKQVLTEELAQLCSAEGQDSSAVLPPPQDRYVDYVRWQTTMLEGEEGEALWRYWKHQLGGRLPLLDLPCDHMRPPVRADDGERHLFRLSSDQSRRLRRFADAENVTRYALLLAAFQCFLFRYTGQEDIVVGSSMSGEGRRRFPRVVGYMVNMVPMRAAMSGRTSFRAFLRSARDIVFQALEHQEFPLALLTQRLRPFQDPSLSPIFQASFTYTKRPAFRSSPGTFDISRHDIKQGAGQYDLNLRVIDVEESLVLSLQYSRELFDAATVARMAGHLENILEGILEDPDKHISELPLLSASERRNIVGPISTPGDEFPWSRVGLARESARDARVYVLDEHLQPTAPNVVGEIHLEDSAPAPVPVPSLGAEHALKWHPEGEKVAARLRKTGRKGRYRPDGTIDVGEPVSSDTSVHGLRVDTAAVEASIRTHAAVTDVKVVVAPEASSGPRIVAYLVCDGGRCPQLPELHDHLKALVPRFLLPEAVSVVQALPRTANGEVDVAALPRRQVTTVATADFVAPRTPTERVLATVWAQTLRLDRVGVHDRLFDLGADSITALRIVMKLTLAGLNLTLRDMYQHPTIAELAELALAKVVHAEQGPVTGPVPLTPSAHWFFEQDLPEPHHYALRLLLEVRGDLTPPLVERAIWHLTAHHDALRLRFSKRDGQMWRQSITELEESVPFSVVDLSGGDGDADVLRDAKIRELASGLRLTEGPIFHAAMFLFPRPRRPEILLLVHHLAADAMSMGLLSDDLDGLCRQLDAGADVRLPPKTTSIKAWAERALQHAHTPALEEEATYWLNVAPSRPLRLPGTDPAANNEVRSSSTLWVTLDENDTAALVRDVARASDDAQVVDALLTALVLAFHRSSDERALFVHLGGHGREPLFDDVDILRTVGRFTTLFPAVLTVSDASDPGRCFREVQQQLRNIPHHGIGYGFVRFLAPDSDARAKLRALPQPRVRFNYFGQQESIVPESSLFKPVRDVCRASLERGRSGRLAHTLSIQARVVDGRFQAGWTYGDRLDRTIVAELATHFRGELLRVLVHCADVATRGCAGGP